MSDLTDDISEEQLDVIGNLAESGALGATAWATRQLVREIRRHRSALAADRERVRSVVASEVYDTLEYHHNSGGQWVPKDFERLANAIATRAAEQLATAGVGLSEKDRDELTSLLSFLNEERDRSYDDGRSSDSAAYRDWHGALSRLLGATK